MHRTMDPTAALFSITAANLELKKTPACGYRCDPCSKSLWRSSVFSHHRISSHPSLQHSELVDGSSAEVWGIGGGIGLSCKGKRSKNSKPWVLTAVHAHGTPQDADMQSWWCRLIFFSKYFPISRSHSKRL